MALSKLLRPGWVLAAITIPAAFGQGGMGCIRVESTTPIIRAEGLAELLPDLVLECTGGNPTPQGQRIPPIEIIAIASSPLANRVVKQPVDTTPPVPDAPLPPLILWTDAVLIIDDPIPSQQTACAPAKYVDSCEAAAGGVKLNVFQGQQLQQNAVLFRHIPVDPPAPGHTRRIRITNLRVDASKIPAAPVPQVVTLHAQIFDRDGRNIAIANSELSAPLAPGAKIELRTPLDEPVTAGPLFTITPAMVPVSAPGPEFGFNIKFTEGFPGAFKRRNLGTSGNTPNLIVNQSDVGSPFYTETGYFNARLPETNDLNLIGLADTGTRLQVTITGIPDNVNLYVGARDVPSGTTGYSVSAPRALLTYIDANGQGVLPFGAPSIEQYNVVNPSGGTATLSWEVVSADPSLLEEISVNIRVVVPNGVPRTGTAQWQASLGPIYPNASASRVPFPSFAASPVVPAPVFRIVQNVVAPEIFSVSAATLASGPVAPGSIVTGFGSGFTATTFRSDAAPLPQLGPITVDVIDLFGVRRVAPLYLASPEQLNFVVSADTVPGQAVVNVSSGGQSIATGTLRVTRVAPGLFSATGDGKGIPAGFAVRPGQTSLLARFNAAAGTWIPEPVVIADETYLSLYGTGIRGRHGLSDVQVKVGGVSLPVTFAGAHAQLAGVDQVNAGPLPASLKGRGDVDLELIVEGQSANRLTIQIAP